MTSLVIKCDHSIIDDFKYEVLMMIDLFMRAM